MGKCQEGVCVCSLIPRPSPAPVFDCLQYAKVDQKVLQAIKSWRQEWPGNEASVCGENVVHTEVMVDNEEG